MSAPRPTLHLHIERLVLDGLPFHGPDAALFQSGFEAELARLAGEGDFTEYALPSGALWSLPAAAFAFDDTAGPLFNGRQAAAALYGRLHPATPQTEVAPERRLPGPSRPAQ